MHQSEGLSLFLAVSRVIFLLLLLFCFVIFNTSWCLSSGLSHAKCRARREVHRGREEGEESEDKKKKLKIKVGIATKIITVGFKKKKKRRKKYNKTSTPKLQQEDEKYFKGFIQQESLKALQSFIALLTSNGKLTGRPGQWAPAIPALISIIYRNKETFRSCQSGPHQLTVSWGALNPLLPAALPDGRLRTGRSPPPAPRRSAPGPRQPGCPLPCAPPAVRALPRGGLPAAAPRGRGELLRPGGAAAAGAWRGPGSAAPPPGPAAGTCPAPPRRAWRSAGGVLRGRGIGASAVPPPSPRGAKALQVCQPRGRPRRTWPAGPD
ncbi:myosin IC heavy chain-like [Falco cherrug]|uniref:myosin IC heavy chain-like n=1 Tax=Falco cherrug TaxID=345164 RepID=UPI00247AA766|nr:myosin IC heavy chain-like [Falco cherrug]